MRPDGWFGPARHFVRRGDLVAIGGRIQPVDATPFASNLERWIGMHMSGMHGHVHAEAEG